MGINAGLRVTSCFRWIKADWMRTDPLMAISLPQAALSSPILESMRVLLLSMPLLGYYQSSLLDEG